MHNHHFVWAFEQMHAGKSVRVWSWPDSEYWFFKDGCPGMIWKHSGVDGKITLVPILDLASVRSQQWHLIRSISELTEPIPSIGGVAG